MRHDEPPDGHDSLRPIVTLVLLLIVAALTICAAVVGGAILARLIDNVAPHDTVVLDG